MKNKRPYQKLINKIFLQTLLLFCIAIAVIFLVRSSTQGKIGNIIARIISNTKDVDWDTASRMYYYSIRQYMNTIISGIILITFIVFFRIFLWWFTKYFDEMIAGVNAITVKGEEIRMSDELNFMENQLNSIKRNLERSAEAERELEKRKNELIIYLAHDIKTPLTSVIGYLNLLEEIPDMPIEQRSKHVKITLEKSYRLEKLINEFFEVARYNTDNITLDKKEIDLNQMMIQIADEIHPLLEKKNKSISSEIEENTKLYVDGEKIARVFINIIKNAISYGDDNSIIDIFTYEKENCIEIKIKNKGIIPQKDLETIFDKFYRADSARQTATGGTGLGLAIAKDIVTLHKGKIFAECDCNHTIFTVELPNKLQS
ncbi:sensor histidine kinase [Alkaliphilus pronyensis]|uniref:sensor histidine kinase n=1 Tax=Alkaliphilus pronyensis TaxID=1482732 RepID=UPI001FAB216A|nr:HAMP domain-containing sensor histidine kinase [Alkaliphilus pronyensis]